MTLRLNGSTSGYTEIDASAVAGSNTVILPSGNGSANQFLKNGSTAGTLGWSSMVEDSSGRVLVGTTVSTGATANTTPVIAGAFYLVQGSVTAANATATEIFVIPSGNATYIATAVVPNASDTANYHATYLVGSNGSSNHLLTALDPGTLLTMSLSGSSLRVTQSAGGLSEVRWSVTRLATFP